MKITSQNLRWIHVDNEYKIIDQPKQVEHILATKGKKNMSINIAGDKRSLKPRADLIGQRLLSSSMSKLKNMSWSSADELSAPKIPICKETVLVHIGTDSK